MRKITILLSTMVLVGMLVVACAPEQSQTAVPNTESPNFTAAPTGILEMTPNVTLEVPAETATLSPTEEITPGVPVTGNESPSRLSSLRQFHVFDQNGEQLGSVSDLVIDLPSTSIMYVIVDTGSVAGTGSKSVFVPWNSLQLQNSSDNTAANQTNEFVFQGDVETFNNAPNTDVQATVPQLGQPAGDWDRDLRSYWESAATPGNPSANATAMPGTGMNNLQGEILASELIGSNLAILLPGQITSELYLNATALPAVTTTPGATQGNQGQVNVGISDAIINADTGKIDYVVADVVFEDIQHTVPIPLDMLSWSDATQSFILSRDIQTLRDAPNINPDAYPDTAQQGWDALYSDFWNTITNGGSNSQ